MRMRGSFALPAIGLLLLVALPGLAAEQVAVMCSPEPAWCEAVKREFGKTGIQVEVVQLSSGPALTRLRAEKASPTTRRRSIPMCRASRTSMPSTTILRSTACLRCTTV